MRARHAAPRARIRPAGKHRLEHRLIAPEPGHRAAADGGNGGSSAGRDGDGARHPFPADPDCLRVRPDDPHVKDAGPDSDAHRLHAEK